MSAMLLGLCTLAALLALPGPAMVESIAKGKKAVFEKGAASNTIMKWADSESELSEPFNGIIPSKE
jgi:hypothetical protein